MEGKPKDDKFSVVYYNNRLPMDKNSPNYILAHEQQTIPDEKTYIYLLTSSGSYD